MIDYDSPWKDILDSYFVEFMLFFFPDAHKEIDWPAGFTFMDKELTKIVKKAEQGKKYVDKLIKVRLNDGTDLAILIHLEIQANRESDFAKRMFVYSYRLFDRYDLKVASMAVLCDNDMNWRPDRFGYDLLGCSHQFRFPVIKLVDYKKDWRPKESKSNPFAMVVMAHLAALKTAGDDEARYSSKLNLIKQLYKRGHKKQEVLDFLRFIDWVLSLPKGMEQKLSRALEKIEENRMASYVTSWERIALEKGIEQGLNKGIEQGLNKGIEQGLNKGKKEALTQVFLKMTRAKFSDVPDWVETRAENAPPETIEAWLDRILSAKTLEEIFDQPT